MISILRDFSDKLIGGPESAIEELVRETGEENERAPRAVISALDQAGWDIKGKREGLPVHALLGGANRERIYIYANINRRCLDRSLDGFAANARDAVDAGFSLIKIAPFDGLAPDMGADGDTLFKAGMERIAVSCQVAGPDVQVLVDCHWRLNEAQAKTLIREAAALGLYWVECPLPEDPNDCENLIQLRSLKDSLGVRLAGGERGTNFGYFEKFVAAGVYDVIMPDVKYAGGVSELMRIAEMAADKGVGYSPHNPSGPLCHLASLHVVAAVPNLLVLEHQFDESPLFMDLCPGTVPAIEDGWSPLPYGPGIGFNL
jgi:galactonate dehydratase